MPRYFFDIHDSDGFHRDDEGVELPNMKAAIAEGRRALGEMSRDALGDASFEILIRDHGEGPVRLTLSTKTEVEGE